jgi:hypothetical protein
LRLVVETSFVITTTGYHQDPLGVLEEVRSRA